MIASRPTARRGRPSFDVVLPGLLIGEYLSPADFPWLASPIGVTAVLSLQDEADLLSKSLRLADLEKASRECGIEYQRIPIPDGDAAVLVERLEPTIERLDALLRGGALVYLHCNAGMNRAPTVAIGYLHARCAMPLAAARDFVKSRRPCVPYMSALEARYGIPVD